MKKVMQKNPQEVRGLNVKLIFLNRQTWKDMLLDINLIFAKSTKEKIMLHNFIYLANHLMTTIC